MTPRSPHCKHFFLLLIAATVTPCTWASTPDCYPDVASYMTAAFGPDYKADENLIARERQYGTETFTEVADITPGTNIARTLLRSDSTKGLCVVLNSRPVVELKVVKTDHAGRALVLVGSDQAPPGLPENKATYSRDQSGQFVLTRCVKAWPAPRKRMAKTTPCD